MLPIFYCYLKKFVKYKIIDIRKTSALKTRMQMQISKKCGITAAADIRPIPILYYIILYNNINNTMVYQHQSDKLMKLQTNKNILILR